MPSSSPAGSSGTGTGSTANVFTPQMQPQADAATWATLQPLIDASAGGGAGTPAALAYPQAQQQVSQFLTNPALQGQAMAGAQQGAGIGALGASRMAADAGTLSDAAGQVLNQGFDPQSALLGREQNQLLDSSNVVNAMSGVASTPYGASTTGNNLANFNINWDNQRLQRGQQGLAAAGAGYGQSGNLDTAATSLAGSAGGLPYQTGATIASDALQGLGSQTNLGDDQYALPQNVFSDLQNYQAGGRSASQLSGQLGQLGLNQQANSMAGFGQLAGVGSNALFGSSGIGGTNGLLGTGTGGIGGLFSSGGATAAGDFGGGGAAMGVADSALPGAAGAAGSGSMGAGADALPLLAAA